MIRDPSKTFEPAEPDPGPGWLRSRFRGLAWPRPGHEAPCGRAACPVCQADSKPSKTSKQEPNPMTDWPEGVPKPNLRQALIVAMVSMSADDDQADRLADIRAEIIEILVAWDSGAFVPRWQVPRLAQIFDKFRTLER